MKYYFNYILISILALILCSSFISKTDHITIFGIKMKVKDVVGVNDLTFHDYYVKTMPNALRYNGKNYLDMIGSFRMNKKKVIAYNLFNLVDKGEYPFLDEFNIKFYDEVVLPNLNLKKEYKENKIFNEFLEQWNDSIIKKDYKLRKNLLFLPQFSELGVIIQNERFDIPEPIVYTLSSEITKKLNSSIKAEIETNLKNNGIEASDKIVASINRIVSESITYKGYIHNAEFNNIYMAKLAFALGGLTKSQVSAVKKNEFVSNFYDYASNYSFRTVTTGVILFRLEGKIDKGKITKSSIENELKANFTSLELEKIDIGKIAVSISQDYTKEKNEKFSSEFNNWYLYKLLTAEIIDKITLKEF